MKRILQRLKQEFFGVIPTAVFFFFAFQLLAFSRDLIVQDVDVELSTFVAATVGALIVAKVVVVVDLLPFVNRFPATSTTLLPSSVSMATSESRMDISSMTLSGLTSGSFRFGCSCSF